MNGSFTPTEWFPESRTIRRAFAKQAETGGIETQVLVGPWIRAWHARPQGLAETRGQAIPPLADSRPASEPGS